MRQLLLWMNHERDVACEYSRLTSPRWLAAASDRGDVSRLYPQARKGRSLFKIFLRNINFVSSVGYAFALSRVKI